MSGKAIEKDSYLHKGMRRKLVETVKAKGITDERVLDALMKVPRHLFMDEAFLKYAYEDTAFQIGEGQTISQPYTVAYMTQLLDPRPGDKVLEIGTGSGYQACVLAQLVDKVYTIERHRKLFERATRIMKELGCRNVRTFYGDGYKGIPAFAPYDKIIVTAAAPEVPQALIDQLKPGGWMVIPYGEGETQVMLRIKKGEDGSLKTEKFDYFRFVPMLKGKVG